MLDFIWHLRGAATLKDTRSDSEVLDSVEQLLQRQRKTRILRSSDQVNFKSPLWEGYFGPNWLAMVIYDDGRFWIERSIGTRCLKYDLRSLHGFVFCLFGAVMFFGFGAADGGVVKGVKYAAFAFGWLYGMNMVLAWLRIPRAIRKAVTQS
ncbi:hypothetical protein [Sphingomonas sp. G-3-2-10]|uniref:hypothetical protein n=1 Tax=Sphingomonas sp. G-3-2-10 TaxID=2728838 RepID=UPI00146B0D11|nr:hypothetical protein [Sphingomonas sp. G-3-2-10]NML06194.1 hypothetical protein [Sphingomonas sp. G-3-2-10]